MENEDRDIEQHRRIQEAVLELADVMADPDYSAEKKLRTALEIAADRSGFPIVYFTHIDDGSQELLLVEDRVGVDTVEEHGTDPLSETYCRYTASGDPELTVLEAGRNLPRDDPAYERFGFEYYVGIPVRIRGNLYGTLCLADTQSRDTAVPNPVETFLQVLSRWVGHEIERLERERYTSVLNRILRHDLRNSLTVIHGYTSELQDGETTPRAVEIIQEEAESLIEMTQEVQQLDEVVQSKAPIQAIDVVELVDQAVETIRQNDLDTNIEVRAPNRVRAEAVSQLRLAIKELLENAIQHSDRSVPHVKVSVESNPTSVTIRVTDDGPGIPEEEVSVIQSEEDIEQLRHTSGLGLWLVRCIVQQSNGSLYFEESELGGSAVEIQLSRPSAAGD